VQEPLRISILPDGMDSTRLVIVKACSSLRLTSEIRIASDFARETGRSMILAITSGTTLDSELSTYVSENGIQIVKRDGHP